MNMTYAETDILSKDGKHIGEAKIRINDASIKTAEEQAVIDAAKSYEAKWRQLTKTVGSEYDYPNRAYKIHTGSEYARTSVINAVEKLNNLTEATGPNPTESTSAADGMSGTARSSGASVSDAESSNASIPSASSKFKVGDKVISEPNFSGDIRTVLAVDGDKVQIEFAFWGLRWIPADIYKFVEDANGFKIGDRVKIKYSGKTGVITHRGFDYADWYLDLDQRLVGMWCGVGVNVNEIEHYSEPKFKVGDRVKIKATKYLTTDAGKVGTVTNTLDGDHFRVDVAGEFFALARHGDDLEPYDGFMPGDRVRRVRGEDFADAGVVRDGIYTVEDLRPFDVLSLVGIDNSRYSWHADRFELVKP